MQHIHTEHLIFKHRISRKSLYSLQCLLKFIQFGLKSYLITIQHASCHKSGVISSSSSSYCISAKTKKIILTCNKYYQLTSYYDVKQQKHIYSLLNKKQSLYPTSLKFLSSHYLNCNGTIYIGIYVHIHRSTSQYSPNTQRGLVRKVRCKSCESVTVPSSPRSPCNSH